MTTDSPLKMVNVTSTSTLKMVSSVLHKVGQLNFHMMAPRFRLVVLKVKLSTSTSVSGEPFAIQSQIKRLPKSFASLSISLTLKPRQSGTLEVALAKSGLIRLLTGVVRLG